MGKGKQFDLSDMMGVVSDLDTIAGPRVKMIPLEDILDNKANFYKVDKAALKPLADSIAMDGLQQYPVVMPHPDKGWRRSIRTSPATRRRSSCGSTRRVGGGSRT